MGSETAAYEVVRQHPNGRFRIVRSLRPQDDGIYRVHHRHEVHIYNKVILGSWSVIGRKEGYRTILECNQFIEATIEYESQNWLMQEGNGPVTKVTWKDVK